MSHRLTVLAFLVAAASAVLLVPSVSGAPGRTVTLRFFDKPISITLTHADGTAVTHAPYPEPKSGDTLDISSLDYVGTHVKHAGKWTGSTHLRCVFAAGPPQCTSHVALGNSMLVFTGNPGTVMLGTGIYAGATGRVVSSKEVSDNASDVVAKIQLRG